MKLNMRLAVDDHADRGAADAVIRSQAHLAGACGMTLPDFRDLGGRETQVSTASGNRSPIQNMLPCVAADDVANGSGIDSKTDRQVVDRLARRLAGPQLGHLFRRQLRTHNAGADNRPKWPHGSICVGAALPRKNAARVELRNTILSGQSSDRERRVCTVGFAHIADLSIRELGGEVAFAPIGRQRFFGQADARNSASSGVTITTDFIGQIVCVGSYSEMIWSNTRWSVTGMQNAHIRRDRPRSQRVGHAVGLELPSQTTIDRVYGNREEAITEESCGASPKPTSIALADLGPEAVSVRITEGRDDPRGGDAHGKVLYAH